MLILKKIGLSLLILYIPIVLIISLLLDIDKILIHIVFYPLMVLFLVLLVVMFILPPIYRIWGGK